ncbi:hypothetical protein ACWCXH_06505 [Kitasatospora sp. NPDC001660]
MEQERMPRGRRAVVLAGLVLAAAVTVAGCNGDGKPSSEAAATASATASASASGSPVAPTPSGDPSATGSAGAPTASASGGPDVPSQAPKPAGTAPGSVPPSGATPPGPGIAVGEPNPAGATPAVRPAVTYRVDGSNKLTVYFYGGVCQQYALKADESHPGQVDVKIVVAAPVRSGQVCSELAKRQAVTADLRAPLAGRTVNDLSTGHEIPLEADPHMGPDPVSPDGAAQ